ncbi:MAG: hypothetical protein NT031_08090 [Planctomycetota bacterium]|nr:hypothetical protein [Planctomycetota bacterium]
MRIVNACFVVVMASIPIGGCGSEADIKVGAVDNLPHHPYLDLEYVRKFEISRDAKDPFAHVPKGMVWAIRGHSPAEGRVTTADVLLDGRAAVGELEFDGKYWLTFQDQQKQIIWVYEGVSIGLGDTRPTLTIVEFRDRSPK